MTPQFNRSWSFLKEVAFSHDGDEYRFHHCPKCGNTDTPDNHFAVNMSGAYNCVRCGVKGWLSPAIMQELGMQGLPKTGTSVVLKNDEFYRPHEKPFLANNPSIPLFYKHYYKQRGIFPSISRQYKVGRIIQFAKTIAVYQYYSLKNILVNRKYRDLIDKSNQWSEKGAEIGYYGLQFIDIKAETLHVCEGEDDCHALVQMGLQNVVSVPNGALSYTPSMHRINQFFMKIILLFDSDAAGQRGARHFAEKAGLSKCYNILLPYKDARACVQMGWRDES